MHKKIRAILGIALSITLLTGCSGDKLYKTAGKGYKEINNVKGVTFDMPTTLLGDAAAITQISPEIDFSTDNAFLFKDGETQYFYFNMSQIVIAAQKGTNFHILDSDDKYEALKNGNVLGIFFDKTATKLKYEEGGDKLIADVTGGVSITTEIYADFTGKLAVVSDGTEEWSVFAGLISDRYDSATKDALSILDTVTKSLKMTGEGSDTVSESEEMESTITEEVQSIESVEPASTEDITYEQSSEDDVSISENEEISTEDVVMVEDPEPVVEEIEDNIEETTAEEASTEETVTKTIEEASTEEISETVAEEKTNDDIPAEVNKQPKSNTIQLKNQKNLDNRSKDNAYLSGIYDMLPIGYLATAPTFKVGENSVVYPKIRIQEVFTGKEADKIIMNYYSSDNSLHGFEPAPEGSQWNVIKYSLDYSDCDQTPYVNIKLRGMDGETLKYRGIKYSKRTYDIFTSKKESGSVWTDLYCYYAVPNGCKEYALECGDGFLGDNEANIDATDCASYFKINT